MSSPHAAGVAALVKEVHPGWGPDAVKAAVQRTSQQMDCPSVQFTGDPRYCYGAEESEEEGGRTSFFGHGMVDALAAAKSAGQ